MEKNKDNDLGENLGNAKEETLLGKKQIGKIDVSLFLSIAALIIAALQFIVSTPFFNEYYFKTSFEIEESLPYINNNRVTTLFLISNTSKNTVNDVEIGVQMLADDKVQITQNSNLQMKFKENGPYFKNCFFVIDKLVPNEKRILSIHSNFDSLRQNNRGFFEVGREIEKKYSKSTSFKNFHLPYIFIAKSDKGFASIKRQPREVILKYYK